MGLPHLLGATLGLSPHVRGPHNTPRAPKNFGYRTSDLGAPNYVTPLLEKGDHLRAQNASRVQLPGYNASELLTKREAVSNEIRYALTKRAADFRIVLDDFALTHLSFSNEYTAAVEAKQVAQQEAERARYVVEKAIQEKKSIIVKAEGEAELPRPQPPLPFRFHAPDRRSPP